MVRNNVEKARITSASVLFKKDPNFQIPTNPKNKHDQRLVELENELNKLDSMVPKKKTTNYNINNQDSNFYKQALPTITSKFKEGLIKNSSEDKYLFFLVHGLEASSFDMRHIRAAILVNIPNSSVCFIQKNHELTNDSIQNQGKRFAEEIKNVIAENKISGSDLVGRN